MTRYIGIRHRVKKTKEGEARPTQVAILDGDVLTKLDLPDEDAELDFKAAMFPVAFRKVDSTEDLTQFRQHHVRWRKLKTGKKVDVPEKPEDFPPNLLRQEGKEYFLATHVPIRYEGLRHADTVSMLLGGSGDFFAYALARKSEKIEAKVVRMPAYAFLDVRGIRPKDDDAELLTRHAASHMEDFYEVTAPDIAKIDLRIKLRSRIDAMKDRIACEQRLRQRVIGEAFCSEEGEFPEGSLEKHYESAKANDKILKAMLEEEAARNKDLTELLESLPEYQQVFSKVVGCGPMIASRIMAAMVDRRRFATGSKLKAYFGVHLQNHVYCNYCGKRSDWTDLLIGENDLACPKCHSGDLTTLRRFPRRRNSETANWADECRKALFLLGDQFNKRPKSDWGKMLLRYKIWFRGRHPKEIQVPRSRTVVVDGKQTRLEWTVRKYNDGHIHKMGLWRTLTKFVEWLFKALGDADRGLPLHPMPPGPDMRILVPVTLDQELENARIYNASFGKERLTVRPEDIEGVMGNQQEETETDEILA